jgi:murein DD-endopeptidase MepM/ murein hydrolase activator NlpD
MRRNFLVYAWPIVLGITVLFIWVYVSLYYQAHRADIWLQLEETVGTLALPFKMAQLYTQEPVTSIPIPVHGVRLLQIADTWGNARSAGRMHEGVDIFAPQGTPVYAAAPGFVVRTGGNTLGGITVSTVGPGGVRYYYAHLNEVAEGMRVGVPVTTDSVVGFVGTTGNAAGTPPHLHLGTYFGGAQNPYPLLVDR